MPHRPIPRPGPDECASEAGAYVARVAGDDAAPRLAAQVEVAARRLGPLDDARALHRYAPGKWSVKEVVGHLADTERVYAYRALSFARGDATPLPGFDEDAWTPQGRFDARPLADLLAEWTAVRAATVALFRGLPADALVRKGVANGTPVSVRALAWLAVGHAEHHLGVLADRYGV
ncbi:MAG: DinB family protein [Planctomycetes bacterium]|nr:DinB family protein [Planctomycetota bacterium]